MGRKPKDPSLEGVKKVHKKLDELRRCPKPAHVRSFQVKTWNLKGSTKIRESLVTFEMEWEQFCVQFPALVRWGKDELTPVGSHSIEIEQNDQKRGLIKAKVIRIT